MFRKTQARTFIIVSVFWIILSTDVFGWAGLLLSVTHCLLYLDDRNAYIQRANTRAGADVHANTKSPTHLLPSKSRNKARVLQLQADWSDKPKLSALWPTSWFTATYAFYSAHSPLITWKIYQNYSPETACSQPQLCLDVAGRRCEYSHMAIICSLHCLMKDKDHFGAPISYIHPKSVWKSKWSVMEPLCLSDWMAVIIYSLCSGFPFLCSCVCGWNWE